MDLHVANSRITHLGLADDLLVFSHGDCRSVTVIKKSLEEFGRYSGLKGNMQKSTIFLVDYMNLRNLLLLKFFLLPLENCQPDT